MVGGAHGPRGKFTMHSLKISSLTTNSHCKDIIDVSKLMVGCCWFVVVCKLNLVIGIWFVIPRVP